MFRNFNDAKNDMDEALAALEKVRNKEVVHVVAPVDESESKFEGVAGIVDGGVSQLTLDDGMFAPVFAEQYKPFYEKHSHLHLLRGPRP